MTTFSRSNFLYSIICIQLFCYLLFLVGFFPLKKSLPGYATLQNYTLAQHEIIQPNGQYDKVVVVLIDALRTDFVYEQQHMPFVNNLLKQGAANGFIVRANPPTVTLPRIKALTSGTIPGFVDVVLNFDSKTLTEDNILTQAHRQGKKIVFYGDDTWVKLFPDHFVRSDGTTSFFVTDYTEVDDNVTRHLDDELSNLDWDVMILHYLGLDHIGHTVGPQSSLVAPKLQEMDGIIQKIYEQISKKEKNFLMLVCGDHGMSDQGGHGGASDSEVLVPAVFLSPTYNFTGKRRESHRSPLQIDIAPTLSVLMGIPIPANNLGQILLDMLDGMDVTMKLNCMYINTQQILKLMMQNVPDYQNEISYYMYQNAESSHANYLNQTDRNTSDALAVLHSYEFAIEYMSDKIAGSLTTYDLYAMVLAMIILCLCFVALILVILAGPIKVNVGLSLPVVYGLILLAMVFNIIACTNKSIESQTLCSRNLTSFIFLIVLLCGLLLSVGTIVNTVNLFKRIKPKQQFTVTGMPGLLLIGTFFHTLSFASSSFVEEEHQTWYFFSMTLYSVALVTQVKDHIKLQKKRQESLSDGQDTSSTIQDGITPNRNMGTNRSRQKSDLINKITLPWKQICGILSLMLLGRWMRMINQTGNKWLDTPDVGDWLMRPANKGILTCTVVVLSFFVTILVRMVSSYISNIIFMAGIFGCYLYRVATGAIYNLIPENVLMVESSQGLFEASFVYGMIIVLVFAAIIKCWLYTCMENQLLTDYYHQLLEFVKTIQNAWILVMFLLLRPHNMILVAMVVVQEMLLLKFVIKRIDISYKYMALLCWWIGQASFFQQGNSNSISSIDVSAGYVGLQDYQPVIVSLLLFCSTYAGPIYWLISLVKFILYQEHNKNKRRQNGAVTGPRKNLDSSIISMSFIECSQIFTSERIFTLLFYCIVVTSQRYHLFVWTVFSPKLLYEAMLNITVSVFCICILSMTS